MNAYDKNFLWGAALSAHQNEGVTGGGDNSDWWLFEHMGHTENGDTADVATDHWNRYEEDFKLAKEMNLNSIRTSLAWEKIAPKRGVFSKAVIDHYRLEIQKMKSLGLRPMITLMHGTVPLWFQERGGWLNSDSVQDFVDYVDFVVSELKDECDLWITFNEPMIFLGLGYLEGTIPPQVKSVTKTFRAAKHLILAHRKAAQRIHEIQPKKSEAALSGVGLVSGLDIYDPLDSENVMDVWVAKLVAELSNWTLLKAAVRGETDHFWAVKALSWITGSEVADIAELDDLKKSLDSDPNPQYSIDWLGINYYTRSLIKWRWIGRPDFIIPDGPKGDNGWALYPEGVLRILSEAAAIFKGVPLVVTENGVADAKDALRPKIIVDTLSRLDEAKKIGLDVRGYFHWTLTDNFEWEQGYKDRFGLIEIQYKNNLKRIPRKSAEIYSKEILKRFKK